MGFFKHELKRDASKALINPVRERERNPPNYILKKRKKKKQDGKKEIVQLWLSE